MTPRSENRGFFVVLDQAIGDAFKASKLMLAAPLMLPQRFGRVAG